MNPKHSRQLGAILRRVPAATAMPLAAENGVPSVMLESSPVAALVGVASPAVPLPLQAEDKAERNVQGEVPLQITVPKRLLIMATEQDCSMLALILKAVQSLGIEVDEEELRDKRRKT